MRRYRLDFAPMPALSRVTLAVLLAGLLGCAYSLWQREGLLAQLEQAASSRHHLEQSLRKLALPRRTSGPMKDSQTLQVMEGVTAELQRPWEAMLDSLQAATTAELALTRIQPAAEGQGWLVSGQADNSTAFLAYVQRLKKDSRWTAVNPLSEEPGSPGPASAGKPLAFQLSAEWGGRE